jgi:putative heme-binding domain-containing protein
MRSAPDGNVYVIDWYDKQACHNGNTEIWDRTNGRIYKISHRSAKPVVNVDLQKKTDVELAKYQLDGNDWYVRHARRILQERKSGDPELVPGAPTLLKMLRSNLDEPKRLRALWALSVIKDAGKPKADALSPIELAINDTSPYLRAWAVQLAMNKFAPDSDRFPDLLVRLTEMAKGESSPMVRLYLASALQRMPGKDRWKIAGSLLTHAEDADDHNLPLMYWYAIEPLADVDPARALALALNGKIPQLHGYMIRRIGAGGDATSLLIDALAKTPDAGKQLTFLTAMREALKGRRTVPAPKAWPTLFDKLQGSDDRDVRVQAVCLAVTFGNPAPALDMVKQRSNTFNQAAAIGALLDAGHPKLTPELHWLLDSELRGTNARRRALRGLASYDDPATPGAIIGRFGNFTPEERVDALNTLASRPSYARALLDAIAKKQLAANNVSADIVRQLRNLKDKDVTARINEVWGVLRDSPAERVKAIADYKKLLTTAPASPPDLGQGRALFQKSCAQCHTLYGIGGKVGPDLTGSNRANLDYLLENILDPSAVIPKEYTATVIETKDGRTITGIVRADTKIALTVATVNEVLTLPRKEVDTMTASKISMMPDDLLRQMSEPEVRALIAYLRSPNQVALPGEKK